MFFQQQQQQQQLPQPHRVKLNSLWTGKVKTWFTLAESTFAQYYVTDSLMRFNLVLPALSEDTLDRVRGIVDKPGLLADPYGSLKARLLEIYQADKWENAARLTCGNWVTSGLPSSWMRC